MADDNIDVKFGAQIGEFTSGVNAVREQIESVTGPVNDLVSSFGNLGEAIIAGLALDRIAEFTAKIVDLGEETLHASETLGIAVPTLSTLNAAFNIAGVGADRAEMAMLRLERAASESQKGTGPLADAFQRLGISATDMGGKLKTGEEMLLELADRVRAAPNDVNKLDAAWQIFGRGLGNDVIPLLNRGRAGIEELRQTASDAGAAIDTDLAQEMEQAGEKGRTLSLAITDLGTAIEAKFHFFKDFADAWIYIVDGITRFLNVTNQAKLDNLFDEIGKVHNELTALQAELAAGDLTASMTGHLTAQIAALEQKLAALNAQREQLEAAIKADAASGAGPGTNPIGAPSDGSTTSDNGVKAATDWERQLNDELRQRVALIESVAAGTNAYYTRLEADAKLALTEGKTSASQELALLVTLENEKYALQQRALRDELSLYHEGETQYQQVLDKMGTLEEQHLAKIDALQEQEAEKQKALDDKQAKAFQEIFTDPVAHAFDSMLQGILQGTQTLGTALTRAFDNLALSFIENVLKMIAQWLAFEAVTAAFGGGAASAIGLSAGPLGALFGGGGLGALFGGGGGAVSATAGLAMFDVGSWSVPSTMPAIVHAGEMIVPADFAGAIRGGAASIGGGGGSPNFNMNVSTNDARSFLAMLNDPTVTRGLIQLIQRGLNLNPSMN